MIYLILVFNMYSEYTGNTEIYKVNTSLEVCEALADSFRLEKGIKEADCVEIR